MKPLGIILGNYQAEKSLAEAKITSIASETEAKLVGSQAAIVAGTETTGSPLHDGLIVLYGGELVQNPKIVENYERVAAELIGKIGQPVAVIHRWVDKTGCSGMGGRMTDVVRSTIDLGILDGENLLFDYAEHICALPTPRYAHKNFDYSYTEPQLKWWGLVVARIKATLRDFDLGADLDKEVHSGKDHFTPMLDEDRRLTALTIAVGYDGIAKYLAKSRKNQLTSGEHYELNDLCKLLQINTIVPTNT